MQWSMHNGPQAVDQFNSSFACTVPGALSLQNDSDDCDTAFCWAVVELLLSISSTKSCILNKQWPIQQLLRTDCGGHALYIVNWPALNLKSTGLHLQLTTCVTGNIHYGDYMKTSNAARDLYHTVNDPKFKIHQWYNQYMKSPSFSSKSFLRQRLNKRVHGHLSGI